MSHECLLRADDALLLIVDVQEKLLPAMQDPEALTRRCRILLEGARALGVPVLVSEQYPRGLGHTVGELKAVASDVPVFEKMTFSCVGHEGLLDAIEEVNRDQIVVAGIEAHICVLQTALDLIEQGAQVHVPADAVASRREDHCRIALERMRASGVVITTVESVLFEMLGIAGTEAFKTISRLVR